MKRIPWPLILALLATVALLPVMTRWAEETNTAGSVLALAMAFLFPIGLALVGAGTLPTNQSTSATLLATLALALALIGYLATGFAFQFGGVAFASSHPGLQNLSRFFALINGPDSAHWGFVGLEGFFLDSDAATSTAIQLFLAQLPAVMSATLIVLLALPRRTPLLGQFVAGLFVSTVGYPLAGHWISGGGWLAHLGHTLSLGHGLVDFLGTGPTFIVSGATVLALGIVFRQRAGPSDTEASGAIRFSHRSLLAGVGVIMAAVGWIAMGLSNPLFTALGDTLNWSQIALNGLAALSGGALVAHLLGAFSAGRLDTLEGPRGALAGLVAISASAPFVPTWAALATGAIAGLLPTLTAYAIERLLWLKDVAALSAYLLPGLWGLLSVALFADGRWGQKWNGNTGFAGQGVSGLWVAPGLQADGGQLGAQIWGGVVLLAWGLALPWGLFKLTSMLFRLRSWNRHSAASPSSGQNQSPPSRLDGVVHADDGS